jgi:hypothetical protein
VEVLSNLRNGGVTMNDDATRAKVRLTEGLDPVRKALDGLAFAAYEAGAVVAGGGAYCAPLLT